MTRPVLLLDIGAGPLPNTTPVVPVGASWVPAVYTPPATPVPTGFSVTAVLDGVLLVWNAIAGKNPSYVVERAPDNAGAPGAWVPIATRADTRYTVTLPDAASYWFRVKAVVFGRSSAYTAQLKAKPTRRGNYFEQAATPTAESVNDLWRDTVNKVVKRWNGAAWVFYAADTVKKNLIVNPTGQMDYDGWTGWIGSGRQRMTTRQENFGRTFACDFADNTNSYDMGASQEILSLAAATAYTLSLSVYGFHMATGSVHAQVRFYNASNVQVGASVTIEADITNNLQENLWVAMTSPANTVKAAVIIRATGTSGGAGAYFRWWNLKFEQSDYPTPYSDDATPRVNPLDNYLDTSVGGGGRWRLGLRHAGSGHRIGDQRNLVQSLVTAYGSVRTATALTAYSDGRVDVNAHTVRYGASSVSYNAMASAVTGLTQNVTYHIYCIDPGFAGGSPAWLATTDAIALMNGNDGVVVAGKVTIPSSGSSGGGGTGDCVLASMLLPCGRRAGDIHAGDWIWGWNDDPDNPELEALQVESNHLTWEPCTRIRTRSAAVAASDSTPMTLRDGTIVWIPQMLHHNALVRDRAANALRWEPVLDCAPIGMQLVAHIRVRQRTYFAGEEADFTVATHNPTVKP